MYRVVVKSRGKYNNVTLGARYSFTKRSAIELAILFDEVECDYDVEKFARLSGDVFSWSDVDEKFWEKFEKVLDKWKKK